MKQISQGAHNLFLMSQEGVVADIEEIDTLKAKSTEMMRKTNSKTRGANL